VRARENFTVLHLTSVFPCRIAATATVTATTVRTKLGAAHWRLLLHVSNKLLRLVNRVFVVHCVTSALGHSKGNARPGANYVKAHPFKSTVEFTKFKHTIKITLK